MDQILNFPCKAVNEMRVNVSKSMVDSISQEGIDAVGVGKSAQGNLPQRESGRKRWYIAIVNNKSEKLCLDRLEKRIENQPGEEKDYEVYVASQKEMTLTAAGKRKWVERILFRSIVFIRCTDTLRKKEIVHLPYIKRFMVNIAGERRGGIRPVAFIPEDQMAKLRRMVNDSDEPVTIDPRPVPLGAKVRINGGKLCGLEGNVLETSDGGTCFVIRIDLLGCAKVSISRDLLDVLP